MKLDHSERLLAELDQLFGLTLCPPSEYETFQMVGLDFKAQGYESAKLGHVSVQTASGMGGAMEMESMIVNPFSVDGPLFSLDLISAQGKYTLMMERYDTLVDTPRDEAPFLAISSAWLPLSMILPLSRTKISSTLWMVERRWATIMLVRPLIRLSMAS